MKKILIVSTYPIKKAQHGGQKRVEAIVRAYRNEGFDTRTVAVFPPDYYYHQGRFDIPVKGKTRKETTDSPYTGDITCGLSIYHDEHVKRRVKKLLKSFRPDIIQIEQVFPYLGLRPLLDEMGLTPKIVLSSHNIEYTHKLDILMSSGFKHEAKKASKTIEECERFMSANSDLVVAVSEDDAAVLRSMGADKVVIAPNGIAKYELTDRARSYWDKYKRDNVYNRLATFIGSAHPPNWTGFMAMVGDRVGFVPPDTRIMLAGSIADYFVDNFKDLVPEHAAFWRRVVPVGRIDDERLAGLIDASEVLLLPITEGGGSNLKTAEAILSGKKIVASTYAFRSFERYLSLPNIYVADTPSEFRRMIIEAIDAEYVQPSVKHKELAESVQWEYSLRPMVEGVKRL